MSLRFKKFQNFLDTVKDRLGTLVVIIGCVMTWSLSNTISYSTTADNHTAMVYLFDTYLAGTTTFTVAAHPDASTFKRVVNLTLPNIMDGGNNATFYFWVNWSSVTPSTITWYEDATYTTVPGDLATSTTNSWACNGGWASAGDWRFWVSNQNAEALLVTKGKRVVMFWPGSTQCAAFMDTAWTGASNNNGSVIGPFFDQVQGSGLMSANWPNQTGSSTIENQLVPDVGMQCTLSSIANKAFIAKGVGFMYSNSSTTSLYPGSNSIPALTRSADDIGYYFNTNISSTRKFAQSNSGDWLLLNETNESKYWLVGTTNVSDQGLALDFGASEPIFT